MTRIRILLVGVGMTLASFSAASPDRAGEADAERRVVVENICREIGAKLSSVSYAECRARKLTLGTGRSVLGRPIPIKEYPPLPRREPLGRVLLVGGIHGDEYSSVSVVFKWMEILDRHHSGLFHWLFVPVLNPDGLLRKPSQRMNANGVDLNRNFPTPDWFEKSRAYWIQRTGRNPRRYPGKAPLSEPESRYLAHLIEEFQPDVIVSVHAPFGILDFDGPARPPRRLGQLYLNLLGTYPGSLGNYAGVQQEIPVVTIELPHAGIMPTPRQISRIWVDLVRWLRRNMPSRPLHTAEMGQRDPS